MKFHKVTDIIVAGAGTAGLPAAIRAKEVEAEAEVVLLEARPNYASSLFMKPRFAVGFPDEDLYKEGVEAGGEPELWRAYADRSRWLYDWLKGIGIEPIGERERPQTWEELQRLPARGHMFEVDGPGMIKTFDKVAREKKVEVLFNHRVVRLVTEPETKRVLGVKVQTEGEELNYKARKAVILATGGFGRNEELIREFGPEWIGLIPVIPPGHLGDGLKIALDIGAATKNISGAVVPSRSVCIENRQLTHLDTAGSIAVDPRGRRFFDESCPEGFYGHLTRACLTLIPEKWYWLIYDQKIREAAHLDYEKPVIYKGDTIEELARNAGIDEKALEETVDKYNNDLSTVGYDTVFGRKTVFWKRDARTPPKIDTPPFYAIKCSGSFTSFKAGLRINGKAQVLNWFNEVIPRLYAAGEITGGLFFKGLYFGPTMITSSIVFGCTAAENAVKEPAIDT